MTYLTKKQILKQQLQVAYRTIDKLLNDIKGLEEVIIHRENERTDLLREIGSLKKDLGFEELDDTEEEKIKFMTDNYIEPTINS